VSPVTANEFSRIALLAALPGDRLADLASRMKRENVQPGKTVVIEGEPGERFYVVLSGMLEVTQAGRGQRSILKPGDYFGEVALAMDIPRTASVRAITPSTVASCDKATFDEFVRPVFAEEEPERAS
jgi:ATP-binding cassette, subfamily B, bacterial